LQFCVVTSRRWIGSWCCRRCCAHLTAWHPLIITRLWIFSVGGTILFCKKDTRRTLRDAPILLLKLFPVQIDSEKFVCLIDADFRNRDEKVHFCLFILQ
jgi:hypothetical protein